MEPVAAEDECREVREMAKVWGQSDKTIASEVQVTKPAWEEVN